MPRTTAALFTPLFESNLLSLICYTAFHAFFSSTESSDYTASIRSALFCSLSVHVATCFMQLVVSDAGKAETFSFDANNKISYKHALAIANVHCCSSALLLLLSLVPFLQVAAFGNELSSDEIVQPGASSSSSSRYATSQRVNWMHAIVGASGGWVFSAERKLFVSAGTTLPVMGSLYSGIVLAYLTIMFLVSIYLSYMATPESVSSYLFMEPRFLVVATGFFGFGVAQLVSNTFSSSCADPAAASAGFAAFVLATCWFDLVAHFCSAGPKVRSLVKWLGLQVLAIVPVFFVISGDVPGTIRATCGVFCALATVSNAIDVVFTVWNPLQLLANNQPSTGEEAAAEEKAVQPSNGGVPDATQRSSMPSPLSPWLIESPMMTGVNYNLGSSSSSSRAVIAPIGYSSSSSPHSIQQHQQQGQTKKKKHIS
jgi:hypothetical protein